MRKYEEALERLETKFRDISKISNVMDLKHPNIIKLLDSHTQIRTIKQALEKLDKIEDRATPMKVIKDGHMSIYMGVRGKCPRCGETIYYQFHSVVHNKMDCRQTLDWSDEE